jgi:aspartate carbamoyltransferase catalytic subunit
MKGAHFLSIDQLSREALDGLLHVGQERGPFSGTTLYTGMRVLDDKTIGLDFRQPSTRTLESFEAAIRQLGGHPSVVRMEGTSKEKGESWRDEMLVRSVYCQGMVIRDRDPDFIYQVGELFAERGIYCPLINAGNGPDEHPTQALGDLATIIDVMDRAVKGMSLTIVGDLKNGRTIRSLLKGLNLLGQLHITVYHAATRGVELPDELIAACPNLEFRAITCLETRRVAFRNSQVWYMTRTQREYLEQPLQETGEFILTQEFLADKDNCRDLRAIMHPLPRSVEIEPAVDHHPAAIYLNKQLQWNVTMRQVLLEAIFCID